MTIIRNIIVALSMYSRIPMPVFEWKENDTKYALGFIGIVGAIIGVIEYGLILLGNRIGLPVAVRALLFTVIPLIVTGGFHVDGFMDVKDAFNSYKPKEEKLKILKDPHIGAFAVISLAIYGCLYLACAYVLIDRNNMACIVTGLISFTYMRGLGAYAATVLTHSKKDGMLYEETKGADSVTRLIIILTMAVSIAVMGYFSLPAVIGTAAALMIFTLWFKKKCYKEFGGISGDTIGYFITEGELIIMIIAAILSFVQ